MKNHKTVIHRGRVDIHRDQGIVKCFNQTLAERLFGYQYGVEMHRPCGQRSTSRVKTLPEVVSALNNEVTSLTDMKPVDAIKKLAVSSQPSSKYSRPVDLKVEKLPIPVKIRFWTNLVSWKVAYKGLKIRFGLKGFTIDRVVIKENEPVIVIFT